MQPKLQCVKVELIVFHDNQFAIQHTTLWQILTQRIEQFREITIKRFFIAALNENFIAIAKHQCAKPIPLGLENPIAFFGYVLDALREHRQHRRIDGKIHSLMLYLALRTLKKGPTDSVFM